MPATTDVVFPAAGGHAMRAALALPRAAEKRPGVIVIHEIFGLNDDIRRITARIADLGYVAVAPDLFDRPGIRLLCVARTMVALGRGAGEAFDDLEAARGWLTTREEVDARRLGVIGFCMGGGFALLYALRAPLGVAATFYGAAPKTAKELEGVCPVLGSFGGRDRVFAPHGRRLERMLSDLGVPHDVRVYADAGHSFMSHHSGVFARLSAYGPMKVGYNAAAAEDSWQRIEAFFREHLG
jgi:carboxymethylenebutenolidase